LTCRFDPLGLCPKSEAAFNELQTKEINNGRLAMIAVAGFVAQELVNKRGIVDTLTEKTT
jgi:Chlorophyll A-B binding protein